MVSYSGSLEPKFSFFGLRFADWVLVGYNVSPILSASEYVCVCVPTH